MIIVVCNDDPAVLQIAQYSSQQNPALGQVYHYPTLAPLADGEDLFIIGHGVKKGAHGNPDIGDLAMNGLSLDAVQLYGKLVAGKVFKNWTTGRVFILACESLEFKYDSFSFAEVFYAQVAPNRKVKVFGRHDNTIAQIPAPGDKGYVQVTF